MPDVVPFAVQVRFLTGYPTAEQSVAGRAEHSDGPVAPVAVAGELDLATVPELRQTLTEVISPPRQEVIVDLAAVVFIDASGVGVLVGAASEAARAGVKFRLQAPSPSVERVLDLARLDGTLDVGR